MCISSNRFNYSRRFFRILFTLGITTKRDQELSNRFSKAIFFSNSGEFRHGIPEEQKITATCKAFIQNAIVLWNYLYLSQLLVNNADREEQKRMLELIKRGSIITWRHINLHGEYNFTKHTAN